MISIFIKSNYRNNSAYQVTQKVFKGGEVGVQLCSQAINRIKDLWPDTVYLTANITSSDDLMGVMLTVDAIRRVNPAVRIRLTIPYFPYARQDRVCNPGESLSVAVVAGMINSLKLEMVSIADPHSDVTPALINNVHVMSLAYTFDHARCAANISTDDRVIFAPDQGAYKKVLELAKLHKFAGFGYASKERDPQTMEIKKVTINGDVSGKNVLVVDDICDGGRTFLELGKQLREQGAARIELYVTHGIFSYGIDQLCELYDKVYTTNSFHRDGAEKYKNPKLVWVPIAG